MAGTELTMMCAVQPFLDLRFPRWLSKCLPPLFCFCHIFFFFFFLSFTFKNRKLVGLEMPVSKPCLPNKQGLGTRHQEPGTDLRPAGPAAGPGLDPHQHSYAPGTEQVVGWRHELAAKCESEIETSKRPNETEPPTKCKTNKQQTTPK